MENNLVQKQKQDIELTKLAYSYSQEEYSHENIINILSQNDEIKKQICIINLEKLNSQAEADLLISNLTNNPTPVREVVSYKILELCPEFSQYFQSEKHLDIFLAGIIDINPSVSRNVVDILEYVENKQYCLNALKPKISELIKEISEIPKNKSYIANKKNFSLYWYLEALYVFLKNIEPDEEIIEILDQCSQSNEYTIREKCAKIVSLFQNSKNPKLNDITQRLQADENFYVLNRLNNN